MAMGWITEWRRRRVLKNQRIDPKLWRSVAGRLTFLRGMEEHDLERLLARDSLQPFQVGEQQIRPFVGGHAPRETEDRYILFQRYPGECLHFFDQMLFGQGVCFPDRDIRDAAIGAHQQLRLVAPARQVMVV